VGRFETATTIKSVYPQIKFLATPLSYYAMRIENRAQAFEWYHFQWPSVTGW